MIEVKEYNRTGEDVYGNGRKSYFLVTISMEVSRRR